MDEEKLEAATRYSAGKKGEQKRQVKLLKAHGSAELREVASGSAAQSLSLGDRNVGPQIINKDQSRFPGRGMVAEVRKRRRQRRASNRMKKRMHRFRVRFEQERRACCLTCLSLELGNDR